MPTATNALIVENEPSHVCRAVERYRRALRLMTDISKASAMSCEENPVTFPLKQDSEFRGNQDIETDLQQIQKPLNLQLTEICSEDVQNINNCDINSPNNQDSDSHETEYYEISVKLCQRYPTDLQNQDINIDLQQIQNCRYSHPDEICETDFQQNRIHDATLSGILNSDLKSLDTQCYEVDVKQSQNHSTNFQNCQTDLEGSENYHQLQQSHKELQQNENLATDSLKSNYSSDLPKSDGCYSDLHGQTFYSDSHSSSFNDTDSINDQNSLTDLTEDQNTLADYPRIQNCDTDSQQSEYCQPLQDQKCDANSQTGIAMDEKSKPFDVGRNSYNSESYCENLEHAAENNNLRIIRCSDGNHKIVRSSDSSIPEVKSADFDSSDSHTQDLKRNRRSIKRKRDVEDSCPVCGLTIRYSDLSNHYTKEVENLSNIAKNIRKPRTTNNFKEGINNTYVQVKSNRENRLAAKVAKYSKKNETECPVCHLKLIGSEVQVNEHVLTCVREDSDSDIDIVQRGEMFDEYEFGNETRIRAISLVPGGYKSLHGNTCHSKPTDEDDCDLDVDTDDTLIYGETQELDLIHHRHEPLQEELRRAVVSDQSAEPNTIENKKWPLEELEMQVEERVEEEMARIIECKQEISESNPEDFITEHERKLEKNDSDIISCLKEKIKDLEMQKAVKCLICLEPYTKPLVATTCWHVHCEECWLVSMGVKKLCPQCNTIVFPKNLRRIYL